MSTSSRRVVTTLLVCSLMLAYQLTGSAQAPADLSVRTERVRLQAQTFKNGQKVRVHLIEGGVVRGRVLGATDQGLTLQPTPSDEPQLIAYDRVSSVTSGMQPWVKVAIGAGAVAAVLVALQQ